MDMHARLAIRDAAPHELAPLGQLMIAAYASLDGFPKPHEQPRYYEMLGDVGRFAAVPGVRVLVALLDGALVGGVVYFADLAQYGGGGTVTPEGDASAFRMVAVDPRARGAGVGKALVERCLALARAAGHRQVVIHTTEAQQVAWAMYLRMGFVRATELDFMPEAVRVCGFRFAL